MGSTADQYQDRPAGLLVWFVLVCRVMPRSLMFQDKLQLYKAKSSIFNSCFSILLYVYWKMEFNLFRFSKIIYLLASYYTPVYIYIYSWRLTILLYVYWKMEFNLFRFSTIIYLLASYCK